MIDQEKYFRVRERQNRLVKMLKNPMDYLGVVYYFISTVVICSITIPT
jgi:hypothetical protein